MKKIIVLSLMLGLVSPLLTFAQIDQVSDTSVTLTPSVVVVYDGTCASNAVITHENNQQTIVETRQSVMKIAVATRRDALSAAYLLSDKTARDNAIKTAHNAFIETQKSTDKTAMDASKLENKSFDSIMKACGAKLPPPIENQIGNQDGSNNIDQINSNQNSFRILRQGLRGDDVKNIQRILGLIMDGVYGPKTAEKVKEWQAQKGLKEDGIIGNESIKEIEKEDSEDNEDINKVEDANKDNSNSLEDKKDN